MRKTPSDEHLQHIVGHRHDIRRERAALHEGLTALEQMGLIPVPDDASEDLWGAQNRGELGTASGGNEGGRLAGLGAGAG